MDEAQDNSRLLALIGVYVCACGAILAAYTILNLSVPIWKTGYVGMGLLSGWLASNSIALALMSFIDTNLTLKPKTKKVHYWLWAGLFISINFIARHDQYNAFFYPVFAVGIPLVFAAHATWSYMRVRP